LTSLNAPSGVQRRFSDSIYLDLLIYKIYASVIIKFAHNRLKQPLSASGFGMILVTLFNCTALDKGGSMTTRDCLETMRVSRDDSILTEEEWAKLASTVVGIASLDGSGILLAERMARFGFSHLHLNEPAAIKPPNRQKYSGQEDLGLSNRSFSETAEQIHRIRPEIKLKFEQEGLQSQDSAARFSEKCELIIDTMNYRLLRESIFLQRAARQKGIFYLHVKAVGYGAQVVIFNPFRITLEEYYCLPADLNLSKTPDPYLLRDRFLPEIPSYMNENNGAITDSIDAHCRIPTNEVGRVLASILATTEVTNIILGKRKIPTAPSFIYIDLMDRRIMVRSIFRQGAQL
jgi:hypothetical protein